MIDLNGHYSLAFCTINTSSKPQYCPTAFFESCIGFVKPGRSCRVNPGRWEHLGGTFLWWGVSGLHLPLAVSLKRGQKRAKGNEKGFFWGSGCENWDRQERTGYLDIPNYCRFEYESWSLFLIKAVFRGKGRRRTIRRLNKALLPTKPHFSLFAFQDHQVLEGFAPKPTSTRDLFSLPVGFIYPDNQLGCGLP